MDNTIELGTLLSICSGIALAIVEYVRTRIEDRKRYTLGMLMGYAHSTELLKSLHFVREHGARGRVPGEYKLDSAIADHLAIVGLGAG